MANENRYIVLGANRYDFQDNNSGGRIKGCKVRYIPQDAQEDENNIGVRPIELNADYEKLEMFKDGPGVYDLGFLIVPGTRGTPKMILSSAKLIKKIDFKQLLA